MRPSLHALLAPRSIAFIGASDRPQAPASRGLRHCLRLGYTGALYPVNPRHSTLYGLQTHATIAAVPAPVDLAVVAVAAGAAVEAVSECIAAGVRSVVVCSAGWAEAGEEGQARSDALQRLVAGSATRLLGPNCIGLGDAASRMCVAYNSSFEHLAFRHRWPVGLACQSGAMLGGLLLNAEDTGFGVESFAHVGNGLDIPLEEAAGHLLQQDRVQALALLVEGLSSGDAFVALARQAREAGKRLAVFKAGRSAAGRVAVASHTGALAGADELFDAVCDEHGIVRVDEPEDLIPTAGMLARHRAARGRRVLVFTLSGGAASVMADELALRRLDLPPLAPATLAACEALAPELLRPDNPLDAGSTVFSDPGLCGRALALALADEQFDATCWIGVGAPRDERSVGLLGDAVARLAAAGKPAVIVALSGHAAEAGFEPARTAGIPVARSLRAAGALLSAALVDGRSSGATTTAHAIGIRAGPPRAGAALPEARARQLLHAHGLPMLVAQVSHDADGLVHLAEATGFPVVLKGLVDGITHKTEAGLVALGLRSEGELRAAVQAMRAGHPGECFAGFSVERMIEGGVETLVGVRNDPQFGPMLAFGLGGVTVELFGDVAFRRCPVDHDAALALIRSTRAGRLLDGFRGRPRADIETLAEAMVTLSRFAMAHRDVVLEVEINPLIVLQAGQGAVAVDALVVADPSLLETLTP